MTLEESREKSPLGKYVKKSQRTHSHRHRLPQGMDFTEVA